MPGKTKNLRLLLDDYAGEVSELTAVTQYIYQHFVVGYEDVAEVLEKVALDEMRHYELLGEALAAGGIDPRSYNVHKKYWRSSYINYKHKVCDILRVDIEAELHAIHQYYQHIKAIPDPRVQKMLQEIIEDELKHIQLFLRSMVRHCLEYDAKKWLWQKIKEFPPQPPDFKKLFSRFAADEM